MYPSVTIVTISFRDFDGLTSTLQSVQEQVYEGRIQHVIVDGGSGPEFRELLETQRRKAGISFVYGPDRGIYDAMNIGLGRADGDLIWWLNAGDVMASPYSVAIAAASFSDASNQWGYGAIGFHEPGKRISGVYSLIPYAPVAHLFGLAYVPHPAVVMGANIARFLGGYDLDAPTVADQVFLVRAATMTPPIEIPAVLSFFELGGQSASISRWEAIRELKSSLSKYSEVPRLAFGQRVFLWVALVLKALTSRIVHLLSRGRSRKDSIA